MAGLLAGKRLLITGVITKDSIAFHVAQKAQEEGAEVLLTSFGRIRRMTERTAARLEPAVDVLELDVNKTEDIEALVAELKSRWGRVDGILHAIAFAPEDALGGKFLTAPAESAAASAFRLKALV
jgi:enoyl ACP reductase